MLKPKKKSADFLFQKTAKAIMQKLNVRAKKIIASRFGLDNNEIETLDSIGKTYGITRERVRQIIQEAVNKIKKESQESELFQEAEELLRFTINKKYGIIAKDKLVDAVAEHDNEKAFVNFVIDCSDKLQEFEKRNELKKVIFAKDFNLNNWKNTKKSIQDFLNKEKKTFSAQDFFNEYSNQVDHNMTLEHFFCWLDASHEIIENVFGKWGLSHWHDITPKSTRQKAHLVVKEIGKPLHFKKISALIDKHNLNKKDKTTHPQTVHNELIKDDRFVLVGRGIYALRKWGHKDGTVKDVVEEILGKSNKPLTRDEIVQKVLAIRKVRPTTVVINLNNFFQKIGDDKYGLK